MLSKNAAILALLVAITAGSSAFAAQTAPSEASALASATVTATRAIGTVEAKSHGKVIELALAMDGTSPVYNVTVLLTNGTESNFTVDAMTGTIAPSSDVADNQGSDNEAAGVEANDGAGEGSTEDGGADGESATN